MRVVLINQFYPPAGAPTGQQLQDLAGCLVDRGHSVTVITSREGYGSEQTESESASVEVMRLGRPASSNTGIIRKALRGLWFFVSADKALASLPVKPDVVVCMTSPPFCGWIGYRRHRKAGTPYVLWCMDLYPEALAAHGLLKPDGWLYRFLDRRVGRIRSAAAVVVALGPDMAKRLSVHTSKEPEIIPVRPLISVRQGDEEGSRSLRQERGWSDDEVVLLYSGNMGRAHQADRLVGWFSLLKSKGLPVRLVFCGKGPRREEWENKWKGLADFLDPVPFEALASHLLSADVHLISQDAAWQGIVVPSKFQTACAVGRPVIYEGPADASLAQWIDEYDCGWALNESGSEAGLRIGKELCDAEVRTTKGQAASVLCRQLFSKGNTCERLATCLEKTSSVRV